MGRPEPGPASAPRCCAESTSATRETVATIEVGTCASCGTMWLDTGGQRPQPWFLPSLLGWCTHVARMWMPTWDVRPDAE